MFVLQYDQMRTHTDSHCECFELCENFELRHRFDVEPKFIEHFFHIFSVCVRYCTTILARKSESLCSAIIYCWNIQQHAHLKFCRVVAPVLKLFFHFFEVIFLFLSSEKKKKTKSVSVSKIEARKENEEKVTLIFFFSCSNVFSKSVLRTLDTISLLMRREIAWKTKNYNN